MNINNKIFIINIATLVKPVTILIYFSSSANVALLLSKKLEIFTKYSNFFNVFFTIFLVKLLEYTKINNYLNNLLDNR